MNLYVLHFYFLSFYYSFSFIIIIHLYTFFYDHQEYANMTKLESKRSSYRNQKEIVKFDRFIA